jgi:hypothetical protein
MKKVSWVLFASCCLSACTTHMYVARTTFMDGAHECLAQAYWYKTDYVVGSKADRVLTVTAGGQRTAIQYQERDGRLVYLGEASRDVIVVGDTPQIGTFLCGEAVDLGDLSQFNGNQLSLTIYCRAKLDDLSRSRGYLPARESPYTFAVGRETQFSLTGRVPAAPQPPTCSIAESEAHDGTHPSFLVIRESQATRGVQRWEVIEVGPRR